MIPPLSTLKAYVIVGAVLAAGIGGAVGAWKVQTWRYGALEAERMAQERETAVMRRKVENNASTTHEQDKVRIETEFVPIEKEVERVITKIEYRDRPCLDADGLRLVQRALRATGTASERGEGMP